MATVAHADTLALSFSAYYSNTFITIGEESAGFRIRAAFLGTNHCPEASFNHPTKPVVPPHGGVGRYPECELC